MHREKESKNDLAIVDRQMQSLKQDLAANVADGDAKTRTGALPLGADAHNARPHSAVFGAPETVSEQPSQDFKFLQSNARNGLLNRSSQLSKSTALKEAGAFRAPLPGQIRSFEPRYGDVQLLGPARRGDPNNVVRRGGEGKFILKEVQAVVPESGKMAGRLTEKNLPRANPPAGAGEGCRGRRAYGGRADTAVAAGEGGAEGRAGRATGCAEA